MTLLQVPIRAIGFIINHIARVRSAGTRLFEILDAENLIENNKDETPMQLWMQFVGFQILFGLGFIVALFIVFGAIEWLG